jgi:ABC-type sugar transport system ATPase subunit
MNSIDKNLYLLLQLKNISKDFPGIKALDNVSLDIQGGEVHALCGENGAGKSTLMHILSGNLQPSRGMLLKDGVPMILIDPMEAQKHGIAIVHQERSLFADLSVAENIFAGQQPANRYGFITYRQLKIQTKLLLEKLHLPFISPGTLVKNVSIANQQMIEIAKALSKNPSVLILDEPTASLTSKEVDVLFRIIKECRQNGVAVIYISHRLQEIFSIADRVSVLKDGRYIVTKMVEDTTAEELIRLMIGRDIKSLRKSNYTTPEVALEVKAFSGDGFRNINFFSRKGEIVGLAGLVGAGRTEIAKAIFGVDPYSNGIVKVFGKSMKMNHPSDAIDAGIAYIPEERKTQGVFLDMNIEENILSADLSAGLHKGLFSKLRMSQLAMKSIDKFRINATGTRQLAKNLSGGNQQKVVLAKWLLLDSEILIVDEPTHGVDVGSKFEIYDLLQQQAAKGKSILLISSDLPELLMLSDTIYVLYKGSITKRLAREDASEERILHYAAGMA